MLGDVGRLQPPIKDDVLGMFMDQLNGNISVTSSMSAQDETIPCAQYIPVLTGFRPGHCSTARLPPVRKTIRRDNKVLQVLTLPKVSNSNISSLFPKIENFGTDMIDRNCDLSFLTEVWQKSENKKHQYKIEELFELQGLKYVRTPRPGARR